MSRLTFRNIAKTFEGRPAIAEVDLAVESGSLTAIVGPSGCGKTTLLELGAGLQPPDRGEVALDGVRVREPSRDTAVIFQHHNLFAWLTVCDNVAFGLRNEGFGRRDARARAMAQLRDVGLGDVADKVPAELSGGMRQRVALARALVLQPKVLLMDEPFASLDYQTRRIMQRYLLSVWRKSGATVVLVTHDLDEAIALADRVVLMSGAPGRVVETVDLELEAPRAADDPPLRDVRRHLQRHLETEVALSEFAAAELPVIAENLRGSAAEATSSRRGRVATRR
ncbi:MAG: ABC transporter ATP-binding protein [Actinobacteria bacterium]|nr:ABC transporter ATP-binding protein [Actinomycetota bacterium]